MHTDGHTVTRFLLLAYLSGNSQMFSVTHKLYNDNNNNNDNECDDFDKKSAKRIRPYFSRSVHSDTGFETLACAASQYAR